MKLDGKIGKFDKYIEKIGGKIGNLKNIMANL